MKSRFCFAVFAACMMTTALFGHDAQLRWTPSTTPTVTQQLVKQSTVPGGPYITRATLGPTETSFDDGTVLGGATYYYAVTAVAPTGEATSNEVAAAIPPDPAPPQQPGCIATGAIWQNTALSSPQAAFAFDATPNAAGIDAVTGLSAGPAATYGDLSAIARFNSGIIDAFNGTTYAADAVFQTTQGVTYHLRFVVDVAAQKYDLYATPPGGAEVKVAAGYAFRAPASSLANFGAISEVGVLTACNLSLGGPPPPTPVSISISPMTATLAAGAKTQFAATVSATWIATGGTVDASGLYTAPATAGNYSVTAISTADNSKTASAQIVVAAPPPPPPPAAPTITKLTWSTTAPLKVGTTVQLKASVLYSDGTSVDVTSLASWASSNTKRLSISSSGLATVKTAGLVTIVATLPASVQVSTLP